MRIVSTSRAAVLVALALALGGCKVDLYTRQTEVDANDMVAALRLRGIEAEKASRDGGKSWVVAVDEDDMPAAVSVLRSAGLPQTRHSSLGDLFKKEGLVSTPAEERVRFIYGTTEELSGTLSRIDGVIAARVHIVLPQNDPLASAQKPSSASVFVKYRPEANVTILVPAIRNLVSRSVEGLVYDNVSVTMVPGEVVALPAVPPKRHSTVWVSVGVGVLFVLLAAAGFVVLRRRQGENEEDDPQPASARTVPREAALAAPAPGEVQGGAGAV